VLFLLCLPTVPEPWRALYDLTFVALAAPLLVAAGTQASPSAAARPFFVALGAISFPLYVLHEPLRPWLLAAAERVGFEGPAAGLAYVVAIVGLAWLAAPLDAAVRRWLLGRSRKPANQPF
jgi:peptidoglycan/LPS O-acetylase OafA/YrhL